MVFAKIGKAVFHRLVRPGDSLTFQIRIEQISEQGASTSGTVKCGEDLVAEIEIMFSHIDHNMSGMHFPEHNFVFTEQFINLLGSYKNAAPTRI